MVEADTDLETMASKYNHELASLLDAHAPLVTKRVTSRTKPDWVTEDLLQMKKVRKAEKTWRKNKNTTNKDDFDRARQQYRKLVRQSEWDHIINTIKNCGKDSKKLYGVKIS